MRNLEDSFCVAVCIVSGLKNNFIKYDDFVIITIIAVSSMGLNLERKMGLELKEHDGLLVNQYMKKIFVSGVVLS